MEVRDDRIVMNMANEFEYGVYLKFFVDEETLKKAANMRFSANTVSS